MQPSVLLLALQNLTRPRLAVPLLCLALGSTASAQRGDRILVDLSSTMVASYMTAHSGGPVSFSIPLPSDLDICGFTATLQAGLTGPGFLQLTNALDLVAGQ